MAFKVYLRRRFVLLVFRQIGRNRRNGSSVECFRVGSIRRTGWFGATFFRLLFILLRLRLSRQPSDPVRHWRRGKPPSAACLGALSIYEVVVEAVTSVVVEDASNHTTGRTGYAGMVLRLEEMLSGFWNTWCWHELFMVKWEQRMPLVHRIRWGLLFVGRKGFARSEQVPHYSAGEFQELLVAEEGDDEREQEVGLQWHGAVIFRITATTWRSNSAYWLHDHFLMQIPR